MYNKTRASTSFHKFVQASCIFNWRMCFQAMRFPVLNDPSIGSSAWFASSPSVTPSWFHAKLGNIITCQSNMNFDENLT